MHRVFNPIKHKWYQYGDASTAHATADQLKRDKGFVGEIDKSGDYELAVVATEKKARGRNAE